MRSVFLQWCDSPGDAQIKEHNYSDTFPSQNKTEVETDRSHKAMDDQIETFKIKEESILQWEDSPGYVQIKKRK